MTPRLSAACVALAAAGLASCGGTALTVESRVLTVRGGEVEGAATLRVVDGARPEPRWMSVHGDERPSLVFATPVRFRLPVTVPRGGALAFALMVRPVDAPVSLAVSVLDGSAGRLVHEERWRGQRPWQERRLDLGDHEGRAVWLEFTLDGGAATVALGQPEVLGRTRPRAGPNVLLYVVDCLRADHVGAYGYPRPTTPTLDRLAGEGVLFERAYTCAAWTKPSIGCLLTSTYPWRHGARTLDDSLAADLPTLAESFQAAGYATQAWVANPVVDRRHFGFGRGFDRFVALSHRWSGRNVNVAGAQADAAELREALAWVEGNRDRPFFLYLHSLDLHAPYEARAPFDRQLVRADATGAEGDRDRYLTELAYNDREIGWLLERLRKLGLYDRTLVAVTADHGEEFMEHGYGQHGRSLFDQLLHVPLIVKLPGGEAAGRRLADPVSLLDLAPTLLDYAGVTRRPEFEGLSLRPLVGGAPLPARPLFAEQLGPRQALYAVRDGRFKLVRQLLPEPGELFFDLQRDPGETASLLPGRRPPPAMEQALAAFVERGLDGYHLVLDGRRTVRLRAETDGGFRQVMRLVMRTGDLLTLAPDERAFEYVVGPPEPPRHLVLRPARAGSPVRLWLESRQGGGPAGGAVLVAGRATALTSQPLVLEPGSAEVASYAAGAATAGGRAVLAAWYLRPRGSRADVTTDPELTARLKALGYLE